MRGEAPPTRREALKTAGALVLTVSAGPVLAACGSDSDDGSGDDAAQNALERAQESGEITIAFTNEAPFSFIEGDELTGADAELIKTVLGELGIQDVERTLLPFDSLIPALNADRYDIAAAGQYITPERCQELIFSRPLWCINDALAVPKGNPNGLSDYESVAAQPDIRMGLLSGSTEIETSMAAGVTEEQIDTFKDHLDGLEALRSGRVDTYSASSVPIRYIVEQTAADRFQDVEVLDSFESVVDGEVVKGCAGFTFRKEDAALRDAVNTEIEKLGVDGVAELVNPFGIESSDVQRAAELTLKDLGC